MFNERLLIWLYAIFLIVNSELMNILYCIRIGTENKFQQSTFDLIVLITAGF